MEWADLPPDLQIEILSNVQDANTLKLCREVCREWRGLIDSPSTGIRRAVAQSTEKPRKRQSPISWAAEQGYQSVLEWLRERGCPWNKWTCANVASGGHLSVLQWAREHGCEWDSWTCAYAAQGGHLSVLRWARSQDCPWNGFTCAYAALGGHLAVLQWLREQDCPWDSYACAFAALGGHQSVLQLSLIHI